MAFASQRVSHLPPPMVCATMWPACAALSSGPPVLLVNAATAHDDEVIPRC